MYLQKLGETIKSTSLCGLGQTAPNPVLSTLKWFRDEYEAHIYDRHCPAGACKELVGAACQNTCPVGTEVWRYVAHIARGEYKEAYKVIRAGQSRSRRSAPACAIIRASGRAGRQRPAANRSPFDAQAVRGRPRLPTVGSCRPAGPAADGAGSP